MSSILSATRAEPLFETGVAPTLPKTQGADIGAAIAADVDDALARLAHQGVSDMPDPQRWGRAFDQPADARAATRGLELGPGLGPELGPADLSAQFPREPRSRGTLARVAIAVCLCAGALWVWRAYGGPTRDMMAAWASPFSWISAHSAADQAAAPKMPDPAPATPSAVATSAAQAPSQPASTNTPAAAPADRQQIAAMARDLSAMRQTIDRLTAGQEQLTRQLAKLQAEKPQAEKPQADKSQADKPPTEKPAKHVQRRSSEPGGSSDVFDPAQNPGAPGVPRALGSIVVPRASPR